MPGQPTLGDLKRSMQKAVEQQERALDLQQKTFEYAQQRDTKLDELDEKLNKISRALLGDIDGVTGLNNLVSRIDDREAKNYEHTHDKLGTLKWVFGAVIGVLSILVAVLALA